MAAACKRAFSEVSEHEEARRARVAKVEKEIAFRTRVLANTPNLYGGSTTQWRKLGDARRLLAELQRRGVQPMQPIALSAAPRPETCEGLPKLDDDLVQRLMGDIMGVHGSSSSGGASGAAANPPAAPRLSRRSNHLPLMDVDEVQTARRVSELLPKIKDTEMSEMSCTFCTCVSEGQCPHCTQRICKTHLWECCSVPLRLEQLNPVRSVAGLDFHCLCCAPIVDAVGQCPGCLGWICRRHLFSCCYPEWHAGTRHFSYHDSYVSARPAARAAQPHIRQRWTEPTIEQLLDQLQKELD